jgi:hypothetical protein
MWRKSLRASESFYVPTFRRIHSGAALYWRLDRPFSLVEDLVLAEKIPRSNGLVPSPDVQRAAIIEVKVHILRPARHERQAVRLQPKPRGSRPPRAADGRGYRLQGRECGRNGAHLARDCAARAGNEPRGICTFSGGPVRRLQCRGSRHQRAFGQPCLQPLDGWRGEESEGSHSGFRPKLNHTRSRRPDFQSSHCLVI